MRISSRYIHIALFSYLLLIFISSSIPGEEISNIGFDLNDKFVHAIVYLVLFILFFYSLKNQTKSIKLRRNALIFAAVFSALYGVSDELHQLYVPNRSCELSDWIADVSGIAAGMGLITLMNRGRVASLILVAALTASCNTSAKMPDSADRTIKAKILSEECWVDHMPVLDNKGPRLGFQLMIEAESNSDELRIEKLMISRAGGPFEERKFETHTPLKEGSQITFTVIQDRNTKYFDTAPEDNEELQFKVMLKGNNGAKKELTSRKIKPYKVY
ncbi:MAG: VanZ family protein [Ignavibacteria bacterium]|nr:VanZ family protein [Ignavibacteria bacterium]